jgi:dTDP-4-dehydrorhamnose reductase
VQVLITGAGGLVASALVRHFDNIVALKHAALDISDASSVDRSCETVRPDVIINCAVVGVDECERDPALAERVNVTGPANLADAAERYQAAIVHFSSNYVFEGLPAKREPYRVDDEARPINVYGVTKLAGERAVTERCPRAFIIRTSWVYGRGKQNFLGTAAAKLKRGETIQAIGDTWASSTYVADLAERVREIIDGGVFGVQHVVNEGVCSYETFARRAAALADIPPEIADRLIKVVSEEAMNRAPRPPWTPMRCLPPLRSWEEALAAYVTGS